MKRFILFLTMSFCYNASYAQLISGGPEIGINLSSLSSQYEGVQSDAGTRPGLRIGGVLDLSFTQHIALQPGLFYSVKGAQEDYVTAYTNPENTVTTTNDQKYDFRIDYLELPINFEYKFGYRRFGQIFIGGGPYFAYAIGGLSTQEYVTTVSTNNSVTTVSDTKSSSGLMIGNNAATDNVRRGDAGLNINFGFEAANGFIIRSNLGFGMVNIMPGGNSNNYMRNNVFGLTIGYLFGH
jgi:hypothetical protein